MSQPLGVDIDLFEDFLEERWHEDAKCESAHNHVSCTVTVTGMKKVPCENTRFLICQNSYELNLRILSTAYRCSHCGKRASECWSVIPV